MSASNATRICVVAATVLILILPWPTNAESAGLNPYRTRIAPIIVSNSILRGETSRKLTAPKAK